MRNRDIQCVWKGVKPTPEQIMLILFDHEVWLESSKKKNAPHNLSRANLYKAKLSGANLIRANRLAMSLRVPAGRITEIYNEARSINPDTATRLAEYLGGSAEFWLNL